MERRVEGQKGARDVAGRRSPLGFVGGVEAMAAAGSPECTIRGPNGDGINSAADRGLWGANPLGSIAHSFRAVRVMLTILPLSRSSFSAMGKVVSFSMATSRKPACLMACR